MSALDVLTEEGAQVVARCEVWVDDQLVEEPLVVGGQVTYSATSRVLRSCQGVELLGDLPTGPTDPLSPSGSVLRLFRGARDWTGEIFEEPLGRYAFDRSGVARTRQTIRVDGYDFSQLASDARWEVPFVIEEGTNLADAVANATQSRLSLSLWQIPNLGSTAATVPTTVWGEEVANDPWEDIRGLARSDGLEVSFDRTGRLTLEPVPDPDTMAPRWTYAAGQTPTYLAGGKELMGRPYNVVIARGETTDDTEPVSEIAEDDDPNSASYIGRYRRPYFMVSAYIETAAQALNAARGELRRNLGLAEVVSMMVVPHPGLDVWQVLQANDPKLGVDARYIIDQVTLPLLPGEATLVTRRRRL